MPTINKPQRGRPRKSAIKIGAEKTAVVALKREAKSIVNSSIKNKIVAVAITGAVFALISHFVRK